MVAITSMDSKEKDPQRFSFTIASFRVSFLWFLQMISMIMLHSFYLT